MYNPNQKFPHRKSYYLFLLNLTKALNEEYDDAVTYKYYATHQSWGTLLKDKDDWLKTGIIPLSILSAEDSNKPKQRYIDSTEFNEWLNRYLDQNRHILPEDTNTLKIFQVLNGILNYPFVFYPLSNKRELPDICNIFARVNAKGMRLSTFDLMNAFLYPKGVELRKDLWESLDNETLKNIDNNMNEYLLKLISLNKQNYCSSKYIHNLIPNVKAVKKDEFGKKYDVVLMKSGKEFKESWNNACKYAEQARKIIMNTGAADFGAIKTDFIPNTTIVPVLGAILWECDGNADSVEFKKNLTKWYWSAVFSEDYSGSSDSVMAKDFRDWKEWLNNKTAIDRINRINEDFVNEIDFKSVKKGSARYNAVLSNPALNDARDFHKEQIIGTGDYANDKINDHHIFPKQVKGLDPEKSKTFKDIRDFVVNRTLLLDETNNEIKNKKPSQYISEMIKKYGDETKVKEILKKHFISEKAYEYMKEDDFDNFVIKRECAIKEHLISTLGI